MENIAGLGFTIKHQDGFARVQILMDLAHLCFQGHFNCAVIRAFPGDKFLYHPQESFFA